MDFSILMSNPIINVCVISWCSAQLIKTLLTFIKYKKFDKSRLSGSGGMPSSHSAVVCSVTLTCFLIYGFSSAIFAIAFVVAFIVMYDAIGVRWAAGLHAKAINNIVEYLDGHENINKKELNSLIPKLNESLGHRKIELVCGAFLGFFIALLTQVIVPFIQQLI
ncbi:MAG: divergent PAP2 family protein [Clostridia bacterium]